MARDPVPFKCSGWRAVGKTVPTGGPTGGPGADLATLEDAARFVGLLRTWRQARPHWDFAAELLLKARGDRKTERR
jgi:hypothetical protein